MNRKNSKLRLKYLGVDTSTEAILFTRKDCHVCRSEGFEVPARVKVSLRDKSIFATLSTIDGEFLSHGEVSLSSGAWERLGAKEGDEITLSHPKPLHSLSFIRSKVYGKELSLEQIQYILDDVVNERYSDIHLATFLTACAGNRLTHDEIIHLTYGMFKLGQHLSWPDKVIVDKHCVGGLPGNRTTPIIVSIVSSFGMMMPKTSSRAITSPSGTADTMEVLAPVDLTVNQMKQVVEQERGCIVWGGAVSLSPADDLLIRVERVMDLDTEGQLIASVLSKKIAAGSTHVVIDIPVGQTAKVRSLAEAERLKSLFELVASVFGIHLKIILTNGEEPVGRGIGPALEARDILEVLQNKPSADKKLRDRALMIAGLLLEFSPEVSEGEGRVIATRILQTGEAWNKFQAICAAQGGLKDLPVAAYIQTITAQEAGVVVAIDNRRLATLAKLAGAPGAKAAGVDLHVCLHTKVTQGQPLMTIHAESKGELNYALSLLTDIPDIIQLEAC